MRVRKEMFGQLLFDVGVVSGLVLT
jgi:hypothetical protein